MAPYKVIALGLLSPRAVRAGAVLSFGVATGIGLYLVLVTGWALLLCCAASLLVAYGYSAGPVPLGNVGLGQPLVFVFMGLLMVMATYYVQTVTLTGQALLAALPVACLVTAILVVNDLRDIEEDRQMGKITPVSQVLARGLGWGRLSCSSLGHISASCCGSWPGRLFSPCCWFYWHCRKRILRRA